MRRLLLQFLTAVTVTDVKLFLQFKVWVKPGAEQSFLYGNHVLKSGLGRITENTMQYQGVVVYSMADVPLVSFAETCVLWVLLASQIQLLTRHHRLLSGFWRRSQVHSGVSASGPHVHSRVPPGWRGRIYSKRRLVNIKDTSKTAFFFFLINSNAGCLIIVILCTVAEQISENQHKTRWLHRIMIGKFNKITLKEGKLPQIAISNNMIEHWNCIYHTNMVCGTCSFLKSC